MNASITTQKPVSATQAQPLAALLSGGAVQEGLKPSTIIEVHRQESNLLDQICKMGQSTPEAKQMLDYHTPLKHFI